MVNCPSCAVEISEDSRFCSSCGEPLDPALTPTRALRDAPGPRAVPSASQAASLLRAAISEPSQPGHYATGDLVAGRYKIVGLLGRGGMGEVYRADDLTLGQPVALKFLATGLAADGSVRERFFNEVRVARQITHPNVCRVHDIGEFEGQPYLSMEYVDGEDLASLLRRIGRLPGAKAVEIARQLCAGLAAAHQRGVLHRDLKPANVMIDGRGTVRITDFGLAGLAEHVRGRDLRSGTPAYMAPEQLAGREVSVRSDIWSLGLVLYEVFTGRRAFEARNVEELRRLHESSQPSDPSRWVEDIDSASARVILRCLELEPDQRPASALAVAAALPGGDPVAAALAAGETPSPELVAASAVEGSLRPAVAVALLAGFLVSLMAFLPLARRVQLVPQVPLPKPRAVLADSARTVLDGLGHAGPGDAKHGFYIDQDYLNWLRDTEDAGDRWEAIRRGRPSAVNFWYRRSPRTLIAREGLFGRVGRDDPPPLVSGMASLELDTSGRLIRYESVPRQLEEGAGDPGTGAGPALDGNAAPDWAPLFAAAGLDPAAFVPAAPLWVPPDYADARAAWTGELDGMPEVQVRVEAAAHAGRPVWFRIIGPWTRAERQSEEPLTRGTMIRRAVVVSIIILAVSLALFTARRNLRAGRGDRRGAFRLGLVVFLQFVGGWLFLADHTAEVTEEWNLFVRAAGLSLFVAGLTWLFYVALEPYVRRAFPDRIVAWTRLLALRFRDPLVGRDVLIGCAFGGVFAVLVLLTAAIPRALGDDSVLPLPGWTSPLLGLTASISQLLRFQSDVIFSALFIVFVWHLLRRLLRVAWLGDAALFALLMLSFVASPEARAVSLVVATAGTLLVLLMIVRFGLVVLLVGTLVTDVLVNFPAPAPLDAWWAAGSWLAVAAMTAVACYGFWVSLGGQPVFRSSLLED